MPEFAAPHDVGRSPDIEVSDRRLKPGDRVYVISQDELGRVQIWGKESCSICLDSRPQCGSAFKNSDLMKLSSEPCPANFAGQGQGDGGDAAAPQSLRGKHGEYWVEEVWKTVNGKKYGPYRYKRWRDENGRKRSKYLGKADQN